MRPRSTKLIVLSTAAMVLALAAPIAFSPPAMAQASGMAGLGQSDTISLRATVKSVDLKARVVTLVGPLGNTNHRRSSARGSAKRRCYKSCCTS